MGTLKVADFSRAAGGQPALVDPRGLRETRAVAAGGFGWSPAELKRLPLGELLEYSRLATRVLGARLAGRGL